MVRKLMKNTRPGFQLACSWMLGFLTYSILSVVIDPLTLLCATLLLAVAAVVVAVLLEGVQRGPAQVG
jgi:hypothetical protein